MCLYPGVYKLWLPIAKIIDEFPDWDLGPGEETEKLYSLKQKYIEEVHAVFKFIQEIEALEAEFNKTYSHESLRAFYQIAKFGLQLKAREEKPFASDNWSNPQCKDELIKKVEKFLVKHLR